MISLNASSRIGDMVEASPHLWRTLQTVRYRNSAALRKFVTPEHHIVLEGFPRCGNSFAVRAFLQSNGSTRHWAIATHAHRIAQLKLAIEYGLPTCVFTREPSAAVQSLVALTRDAHLLTPDAAAALLTSKLEYYTAYYGYVWQQRDHLVVSDFETTTQHFGTAIAAINAKFGTDFAAFEHSKENVDAIFATSRKHLSPSPERDNAKAAIADYMQAPGLASALSKAESTYQRILDVAV